MLKIQILQDRHCPTKSWGWEEWIVNNDLYCGKRLHFLKEGGKTSLHFHMRKHETMYVEKGYFIITTVDPESAARTHHGLGPGDSLVIEPGVVHQIEAILLQPCPMSSEQDEAVLVEFSTHHEDADSHRVEK